MVLQLERVNPARRVQLVIAFAVALATVGCSVQPTVAEAPTAQQAEDLFAEIVELAQAGDLDGLCTLGSGNCESVLQAAGREVPTQRPRIVVNELMSVARGTDESDTARLLVVCGLNDAGDVYATEMAVLWEGDRLLAAEPVYWSGLQVSTAGTGNEPEQPPASPPAEC